MNIIDIILLICFIPALIQGFRKGFISQAISIISVIVGIWLSARCASLVSNWLSQYIQGSEQVLKIVSFVLIIAGVITALSIVGRILEGAIRIIMLGWLNRLLGIVFALLKTALIVGLVIMLFCTINDSMDIVSKQTLNSSVLFPPLKSMAYSIFPYLREMFFGGK